MIMPSHAKNVTNYKEQMPLFARHQIESYLSGMFNPTVQLPSGGYIVIDTTEALVAVDVNSGRATKEGSIEQTATKTNLEAASEVARQLRLRDLAGLIVIDFIDMDERKNNAAVEKLMKDKLKTDRARIQVGRISGFGLMEMSRQRLRPGMLESTTQPCSHCHGTGLLRSDDNVALGILRQLEEEGVRGRSKEVLIKAPIVIANFLMNQKREHIAQIEARYGLSVRIECDPHLVSPDFVLEKFKTASRVVAEAEMVSVISSDTAVMVEVDDVSTKELEIETTAPLETKTEAQSAAPEQLDGDAPTKKRRRRRRRRRGASENAEVNDETTVSKNDETEATVQLEKQSDMLPNTQGELPVFDSAMSEDKSKPKAKRTRVRRKKTDIPFENSVATEVALVELTPEELETKKTPKPKRTRAPRKKIVTSPGDDITEVQASPTIEASSIDVPVTKPKRAPRSRKKPIAPVAEIEVDEPSFELQTKTEASVPVETLKAVLVEKPKRVRKTTSKPKPDPEVSLSPVVDIVEEQTVVDDSPKKRGWWSLGR